MSRRHILFACEGATCAGTLDKADGRTGLLIVTGGNEVRAGAWNGQAMFAAKISGAGFPVLRFDQRGKGDSDGPPGDFRSNGPDIAAALAAFRAECPALTRVVAIGNCDAASALMLGGGVGCDALVLSNPWTIEDEEAAPPPEALRGHYARRLTDPAAILRLLRGGVNLRGLLGSLIGALRPAPPPTGLAQDMADGLAQFSGEGAPAHRRARPHRPGLRRRMEKERPAHPHLRRCDPQLRRSRGAGMAGSAGAGSVAHPGLLRMPRNLQYRHFSFDAANSRSAMKRSASSAAMQPVPAAVTAWR